MGQEQPEPAGAAGCRCRFGEVSVQEGAAASFKAQRRLWCWMNQMWFFPIRNYTIRFMPVPIMDAAQALKANPEKTEDALLKVLVFLFFCLVKIISVWSHSFCVFSCRWSSTCWGTTRRVNTCRSRRTDCSRESSPPPHSRQAQQRFLSWSFATTVVCLLKSVLTFI